MGKSGAHLLPSTYTWVRSCKQVVRVPRPGRSSSSRRRQWQPTPVLLPGKSHGRRSPVGCSPWGHEESDMTEGLHFHFSLSCIGEGSSNPLQCSCLGMGEPGLPSLGKAFLSLLAFLRNSAFRCLYLSFSPLLFASLLFTAICKASPDSHFAFLNLV